MILAADEDAIQLPDAVRLVGNRATAHGPHWIAFCAFPVIRLLFVAAGGLLFAPLAAGWLTEPPFFKQAAMAGGH